jgi:hypothetical protein
MEERRPLSHKELEGCGFKPFEGESEFYLRFYVILLNIGPGPPNTIRTIGNVLIIYDSNGSPWIADADDISDDLQQWMFRERTLTTFKPQGTTTIH